MAHQQNHLAGYRSGGTASLQLEGEWVRACSLEGWVAQNAGPQSKSSSFHAEENLQMPGLRPGPGVHVWKRVDQPEKGARPRG